MRRFLFSIITVLGLCTSGLSAAAVITGTSAWSGHFAESAISTDLKYADGSPYSDLPVLMICADVTLTYPEGNVSFVTGAGGTALKGGSGEAGVAAIHWLFDQYYSVYYKNGDDQQRWAFQYAVWEIGNDYTGNVNSISATAGLSRPSQDTYFPSPIAFTAAYETMYQAMASALPTLSSAYRSTTYTLDLFNNSDPAQQSMVALVERAPPPPAVPPTPTAVPTMGQWSLLGLSSIVLMFAAGAMRRRQL